MGIAPPIRRYIGSFSDTSMDKIRRFTGRSIIYMLGIGISRGLPVLLLPIYLHYLTPTGLGYLAIAEVITSLSKVLLSQGLDASVFHYYLFFDDDTGRRQFIGSLWLYGIVSGTILAGAAIWIGDRLHRWVQWSVPFHPYFSVALITGLVRSLFELYVLQILRAKGNATGYALISMVSLISTVVAQLVFLIDLNMGSAGIVLGGLVGSLVASLVSIPYLISQIAPGFSIRHVRRGLSYSIPLVPHMLGHWLMNLSDRFVLERYVPMSAIGIYSVGDRFRQGYAIITWGLNSTVMPTFAEARRNEERRKQLPRIITYYALIITWAAVSLISASPIILQAIAPESFEAVTSITPWLIMGGLAYGFYSIPMNILSQTIGKTRAVPIVTLLSGFINIMLNFLTIPHYGIMAAAFNAFLSYSILFFAMHLLARRYCDLQYETRRLGRILASAIGTLLVFGILSFLGTPQWINLFIAICGYPLILLMIGFLSEGERILVLKLLRERAGRKRDSA